ncbi:MAG: hypothetical protein ACN6O3_09710 [Comamonas sp.]
MRATIKTALLALALAVPAAWAARDFTPQAGTWIVSSELDGKPGRGLAIDVQGNTFFMQVFGYEQSGDATFYTATGQMDGNGVAAPLMRWRGGRSFGNEARDGEEDGSPGEVKVSFVNGLKGTVQFPGEAPAEIERFVVPDAVQVPGASRPLDGWIRDVDAVWMELDERNIPIRSWHVRMVRNFQERTAELELSRVGDEGWMLFDCKERSASGADSFQCTGRLGSDGDATPTIRPRFRLANGQVTGWLDAGADGGTRRFMGVKTWQQAMGVQPPIGCRIARVSFVQPDGFCRSWVWMPSPGTWVVADELGGKPGRGLGLDIQGDVAIAQVFNYLPDGRPTFHMGSASYNGSAEVPMDRYRGGRSLGGKPQSAELAEQAGSARLSFNAGLDLDSLFGFDRFATNALETGTITFPGEPPAKIQRLALEPAGSWAESMYGVWAFSVDWRPEQAAWVPVELSRTEGGMATNADGSVRCAPTQWPLIRCDWWGKGPDGNDASIAFAEFYYSPLSHSGQAIRIKDRHGNSMGLGPLD